MMVSTIDRMGHEARAALAEATARLIVLCQEQIEQASLATSNAQCESMSADLRFTQLSLPPSRLANRSYRVHGGTILGPRWWRSRVPTTAEVWERDRARWVDLWAKPGVTFD